MNGFIKIPSSAKPGSSIQKVLCLLMVLLCNATFALPDFTLNSAKTDETCLGNGTLTFWVSGTDPAATIQYKIYQLPDTTTAIAVQTDGFLGGRASGDYLIVAIQTLGTDSNSQSTQITIDNAIVPLAYNVSSTHALCGPDASITITPTSGSAVQYEIISGPVIRPLQSSPVFSNIPAGLYNVRVFDACGVGWVTAHTVISDAVQVNVGLLSVSGGQLVSCNSIQASTSLTSTNGNLPYPMTAEFTVYPPDGSTPIVMTQPVPSDDPQHTDVDVNLPMYYDQDYYCDIKVTDACGNIYTRDHNLIHVKLTAALSAEDAKCGQKFLSIAAGYYMTPISIQWTAMAPGFDPANFNADHPGPFSEIPIHYGNYDMPVPWGHYAITLTDACGHSAQAEVTIQYVPPHPVADIEPYLGCDSNKSLVKIQIPGFTIVTAIITAAPTAYGHPIPDDVTDQITAHDGVVLDHLITGNYTIHLVDDCGNPYDFDFFVPDTTTSVTFSMRNDCELGKGTVRIRGSSTNLTAVVMTVAPSGFGTALPYDVGFNLTADGIFSMAGLLPGSYTFHVTDSCGLSHDVIIAVVGYAESQNDFALTPHCGSFDFEFHYTSTANGQESFWLQKYNPVTSTWGNPVTGAPYTEGDIPTNVNSIPVINNAITLNQAYTGQFRILKRFESFENGSAGQFKECFQVIREFEFTGQFQITGFEKITCDGALADIKVLTNGVPPLTYKIIKKNGLPFFVDNGNNNIFTNLEQAVYTFQVQHACGHIATGDADVAQLPSLANAHQPGNLEICDDISNDGQATFDLSSQNATILGSQNPADFTLTYHISPADATTGSNPLSSSYISGNATIYARLKYNNSANDCFDIVSFQLIVHPYPVPDMKQTWELCQGNNVTITAPAGFDHYDWSTGQHSQSITVSQSGQYVLTVTQGNCSGDFPVDVVVSNAATIEHITISDWTNDDNSITVILSDSSIGDYAFSIDGVHYQASNVFDNLPAGAYTVYVKNLCGLVKQNVLLLTYPKFFTPNGDGFNDFWKIKFSEAEPHLMTYVFDRYGKLITGFLPDSPGWDGTLNGEPLPSTDYWFKVIREDGKEYRGHFAMKR